MIQRLLDPFHCFLDPIHITRHSIFSGKRVQQIQQKESGINGGIASHRLGNYLPCKLIHSRLQGRSGARRKQLTVYGAQIPVGIHIAPNRPEIIRLCILWTFAYIRPDRITVKRIRTVYLFFPALLSGLLLPDLTRCFLFLHLTLGSFLLRDPRRLLLFFPTDDKGGEPIKPRIIGSQISLLALIIFRYRSRNAVFCYVLLHIIHLKTPSPAPTLQFQLQYQNKTPATEKR